MASSWATSSWICSPGPSVPLPPNPRLHEGSVLISPHPSCSIALKRVFLEFLQAEPLPEVTRSIIHLFYVVHTFSIVYLFIWFPLSTCFLLFTRSITYLISIVYVCQQQLSLFLDHH